MKNIGSGILLCQRNGQWEDHPVSVGWIASPADWAFLRQWRSSLDQSPSNAARDSVEYAVLACKRWRFLHDQGLAPAGLAILKSGLRTSPDREFGIALALRSTGPNQPLLGFAFARRTWANNLMLEFLAGAPAATPSIKGAGRTLMEAFALLASELRCHALWGECTAASHGFYATLKRRANDSLPVPDGDPSISDLFQFSLPQLRALLHDTSVKIAGCGASQ